MSGTGLNPKAGLRRVRLPVLAGTSPSLAELMRSCMLRAGLSRASDAAPLVLGNPKAWLGTAYHETLSALAYADKGVTAEALWARAVDRQYQRALHHPLDQRYGPPQTWPGYHLIHAALMLRAQELEQPGQVPSARPAPAGLRHTYRERRFSARAGMLTGKPDLVSAQRIVDYKTGSLEEDGSENVLRDSFVRQLRLYAVVVHETLGFWPEEGRVVPLHGAAVRVRLVESECRAEAERAIALLGEYNQKLAARHVTALAMPSPAACKWCPFKLICDPFWQAVTNGWSGLLDGEAVQGVLDGDPQLIHAGLATRIVIEATAGSVTGRLAVMPLPTGGGLAAVRSGVPVRAISLSRRADGAVVPNVRTCIALRAELPVVVAGGQS